MRERLEEILEAIWTTAEKKEYTLEAVKKECDIEIAEEDILDLENQALIIISNQKILFSSEGKRIAEQIIRRHRLAEVLLSSILKLKDTKMEEIACKVEHTLLPEVEEAICTLLGHPQVCPDGRPIPKGQCCEKDAKTVNNIVVNLTELEAGEGGKISYIKPTNHSQLHQLLSFGLNPGVDVVVHRTYPTMCIKFQNTELAIDSEIARNIFILIRKNHH